MLWLTSTHQANSKSVTLILLQMPYARVVYLTFLCFIRLDPFQIKGQMETNRAVTADNQEARHQGGSGSSPWRSLEAAAVSLHFITTLPKAHWDSGLEESELAKARTTLMSYFGLLLY